MKHPTVLTVVGGDERQAHLAAMLCADGYAVRTLALERHPVYGCTMIDSLTEMNGSAAIILPLPAQQSDARLNAPLSDTSFPLAQVLDAIPAGTLTLAGSVPFWMHAHAVRGELRLIDYLAREELAIRNAIPTCEGALQIAMEQTPFTLHGAHCLVIGYGRIGAMLAERLAALGADVTVSARSLRDFARIEAEGLHSLDTRHLRGHLQGFDLIFNTVPAPILDTRTLAGLNAPCLILDLASLPGGIAPDTILPPDCRVIHALSLPGRVAPLSAARAIHATISSILQEEGISCDNQSASALH